MDHGHSVLVIIFTSITLMKSNFTFWSNQEIYLPNWMCLNSKCYKPYMNITIFKYREFTIHLNGRSLNVRFELPFPTHLFFKLVTIAIYILFHARFHYMWHIYRYMQPVEIISRLCFLIKFNCEGKYLAKVTWLSSKMRVWTHSSFLNQCSKPDTILPS